LTVFYLMQRLFPPQGPVTPEALVPLPLFPHLSNLPFFQITFLFAPLGSLPPGAFPPASRLPPYRFFLSMPSSNEAVFQLKAVQVLGTSPCCTILPCLLPLFHPFVCAFLPNLSQFVRILRTLSFSRSIQPGPVSIDLDLYETKYMGPGLDSFI